MRKVVYGAAVSLDGFIAGPNHEVDWLEWSDDVVALSQATFATADTVLMGRKTYEAGVRAGMRVFPGARNIVYSRTLDAEEFPEVEIVRSDAAAHVRDLKAGPGRDIILMGGGELARGLLAAGLVDEFGINVQPVILGGGVPLVPNLGVRLAMDLIESRVLSGGCVYAMYRVLNRGDAGASIG